MVTRIDQRVDKEETHGELAKCLLKITDSGVGYAWSGGVEGGVAFLQVDLKVLHRF